MSLASTLFGRRDGLRHAVILTALIAFASYGPAAAQSYRYIDESGNIHFVDRLSQVPPKYRNQIEGLPPTPTAIPDMKGKTKKVKDRSKEQQREKLRLEKERKKRDEQLRRQREKEMKKQQKIQRKQVLIPRYEDGAGMPSVPLARPVPTVPQMSPGFELPPHAEQP